MEDGLYNKYQGWPCMAEFVLGLSRWENIQVAMQLPNFTPTIFADTFPLLTKLVALFGSTPLMTSQILVNKFKNRLSINQMKSEIKIASYFQKRLIPVPFEMIK